jgi:hypothetical protein
MKEYMSTLIKQSVEVFRPTHPAPAPLQAFPVVTVTARFRASSCRIGVFQPSQTDMRNHACLLHQNAHFRIFAKSLRLASPPSIGTTEKQRLSLVRLPGSREILRALNPKQPV